MASAEITSPHNPRVKLAAKLRERRGRNRQGRFLIDGQRELQRAWQAGVQLDEIFYCPALCRSVECQRLLIDVIAGHRQVYEVTAAVFDKLAFGDRREGIVATAAAKPLPLSSLEVGDAPLIVVLEGVEKPGNLGAVLRSADGAGVDAVILADGVTDLYNPNTIRASLGTIFTLSLAVATSAAVREWLHDRGIRVLAARVDAMLDYDRADLAGSAAIVLGSESHGLSDVWTGPGVTAIRLPMRGAADSLNLSATAAVLLYEARRQRSASP